MAISSPIMLLFFFVHQEGEVRFLICTDVAARGIDITGVPFGKIIAKLTFSTMAPRGKNTFCFLVNKLL